MRITKVYAVFDTERSSFVPASQAMHARDGGMPVRAICFTLALLLTHIAVSAQPTWLFGRHAVIEWKPGPVSTRLWPDTSETAPGILWDGMGRPMLYRVSRSFAWNDGTFIPSTDTIDPDNPNDYYWSIAGNVPEAILVRKPGSRDTVYSLQSHQEGGSPKRRYWYLENGALTAHTLDLSKREGMGFAHMATDTIVKAYDSTVGFLSAKRSAAASQALIPHANGRDLWLIVPMYFPSQVRTFRITPNGIDTVSLISPVSFWRSFSNTGPLEVPMQDNLGECKVSTDGRRVAYCAGSMGKIGLFDFDNATGLLSNEREISDSSLWRDTGEVEHSYVMFGTMPYGLEFSPDGRFVYITNIQFRGMGQSSFTEDIVMDSLRGELVQLDISLPTAEEIKASRTVIVPMSYRNWFGGLQLGPDGRIYVAQRERPYVSAIANPNARGAACGFIERAVELAPGSACGEGFPFIMSTTLGATTRIVAEDFCVGELAEITLGGSFVTDSVVWDFGDAFSPIDTGYGRVGRHIYTRAGAYRVTATMFVGSDAREPVSTWVYVFDVPQATATADRPVVCVGDTDTLRATGAPWVRWYVGDSLVGEGATIGYRPDSTTTLRAVVSSIGSFDGCTDTALVTVTVIPVPVLSIQGETSACVGDTLLIMVDYPGRTQADMFEWSITPWVHYNIQRQDTFIIAPQQTTLVRVRLNSAIGCTAEATVTIVVHVPPTITAAGDTTVCRQVPVVLRAQGADAYTWTALGEGIVGTGASIVVTPQTTTRYVVTGTDVNGCTGADTVLVTVLPGPALQVRGDTISCDGRPVTLTCTGAPAGSGLEILWLDEAGAVVGSGPALTVAPQTSTTYRVTTSGGEGCNDTVSYRVRVGTRPLVRLTPTDTVACYGDTVRVRSSNGNTTTVVAAPGVQQVTRTDTDSVGCSATATATVRGVPPDALMVSMRDTTVEVSTGPVALTIQLAASPELVGAQIGPLTMRVSTVTTSFLVDRFTDRATGVTLASQKVADDGMRREYQVVVPAVSIAGSRQDIVHVHGLPLVDRDTTSTINVRLASINGLGNCVDSSARGGTLAITGCGMEYVRGVSIGSALSVRVQPNPADELINVTVDVGVRGPITIDLVDALGRIVRTHTTQRSSPQRIVDHHTLDLHDIPAGAYRIIVTSPTETTALGVVRR